MFGSSVLEVAIGVIFVYLLLSLICTSINEGIASIFNVRAKNLFIGITNLLNDPSFTGLAQQVYSHGLVDGISKEAAAEKSRLPSYLDRSTFSLALVDILGARGVTAGLDEADLKTARDQAQQALNNAQQAANAAPGNPQLAAAAIQAKDAYEQAEARLTAHSLQDAPMSQEQPKASSVKPTAAGWYHTASHVSQKLERALAAGRSLAAQAPSQLDNIQSAVEKLPTGHTKETLLVLIDKTRREIAVGENEVETLRANIEKWFDDSMDRIGGWYKRWTQAWLFGIGIVVVLVANADTVMLVQRFNGDAALRAAATASAQNIAQRAGSSPNDTQMRENVQKAASTLDLPVGWSVEPHDPRHYPWVSSGKDGVGFVFSKLLGLLITVFAIMLGAPFWFDTLSKFINLRGAGTPPGETKKSARQPKT